MSDITVIIPVYNTKQYLKQCIESVCGQTYVNWDMIIVDDGSTDGSGTIADEYAGSDDTERIKVIHKPNGGQSSARNAGLKAAGGEYVMFLDSDDFLMPDFIETTLKAAHENGLDMVVTPTRNVTAEGVSERDLPVDEYWRTFDGRKCLIRYNVTPRIYRTEYLRNIGLTFSEGELMEDVVFCLAANCLTDRWQLLDYHGYCYRLNPAGSVGSFKRNGIPDNRIPYRGLRKSVELIRKFKGAEDDRILEYCTVRILVTILFMFCRRSDIRTVHHMCCYTKEFLKRYFPDFVHNPYFNAWGEENVARFQSMAVGIFKILYRTHMLMPFAIVYTRF